MEELKSFINENPMYLKILREVIKKYKIYGKVTGTFNIRANSSSDEKAIKNFDINVIKMGVGKIKSKDVERLFAQKYPNIDFLSILEYVEGGKIITNKEDREHKESSLNQFFLSILKKIEEGLGKQWFEEVLKEKNLGYKSLKVKYNDATNCKKEALDELKNTIIYIIKAVNKLPYLSGKYENLSVFAAKYSRDSHFFDRGRWTGEILIKIICWDLKCNEPKDIESLNEIYFNAGLLKDTISNSTTVYAMKGFSREREIEALKNFIQWNQPLQLSLNNLLEIEYLEPVSDEIFIFENPAVFSEIISRGITNKTLICTSGQLNLSSHIILNKIRNYKKIYYAGDFDVKGIEIAFKIKSKFQHKLELLMYNKEHYKRIKSNKSIEDSKLKQLNQYKIPELKDIIEEIEKYKVSAYQELLIDDYIKFISQINQK